MTNVLHDSATPREYGRVRHAVIVSYRATVVTSSRSDDIMTPDRSSKIHMATHFYAADHRHVD